MSNTFMLKLLCTRILLHLECKDSCWKMLALPFTRRSKAFSNYDQCVVVTRCVAYVPNRNQMLGMLKGAASDSLPLIHRPLTSLPHGNLKKKIATYKYPLFLHKNAIRSPYGKTTWQLIHPGHEVAVLYILPRLLLEWA